MINIKNILRGTSGIRVSWNKTNGLRFKNAADADWASYPKDFRVLSECPRTAEDPETPHLSAMYRLEKSRSDNYVRPPVFITKVMINAADTIRLVFTSHEQEVPVLVVNSGSSEYTAIDAGNWLTLRNTGQVYSVAASFSDSPLSEICKPGKAPMTLADIDLEPYVKKYLTDFKAGKQNTFPVGCVIFDREGLTMSYNDSVMVFPNADALMNAVDHLRSVRDMDEDDAEDYENVVEEVVTSSKGVQLVINGTPIKYDTRESASGANLHYINDRKICDPDLSAAIRHILCCPSVKGMAGSTLYAEYIDQVSKISLKFHKAVASGIDLTVSTDHLHNWRDIMKSDKDAVKKTKIRQPGHGSHGGGDDEDHSLTMKLKVTKKLGEKAKVTIFDKTYSIDDLDGFIDACRCTSEWDYGKRLKRKDKDDQTYYKFSKMATERWWKKLAMKLYAVQAYMVEDIVDPAPACAERTIRETGYYGENGRWGERQRVVEAFVCNEANDALMQVWSDKIATECKDQMIRSHEILERSYKLFKEILKDTGAKEVKNEDGSYEYHIVGRSGVNYAVDEATARVYVNDGSPRKERRHICIVKGGGGKIAGYDYIGSVLAALADDSVIAAQVHTLESVIKENKVAKAAA